MTKLRILPVLAGLFLLLIPVTPVQAASGHITGTITTVDSGSSAPVSGIEVDVCGVPNIGCLGGSRTDAAGHYSIDGLPSANGVEVITSAGTCAAGGQWAKTHVYGVNVTDGQTATNVNMVTTKQVGSISGTVFAPNGSTVSKVSLVVDDSQTGGFGRGGADSDGSGHFSVGCLAAGQGSYYMSVFPPAPWGQQVDAGVGVSSGQNTAHDIHLGSGSASINGRITCGGAVCGGSVGLLVTCGDCSVSSHQNTDANGSYTAGNLTGNHKYDVHAFGPAGTDSQITYGVFLNTTGSATVNMDLIPATPAASGKLVGYISDSAQGGLPGCLINAFGGNFGSSNTGGFVEGDVNTIASFDGSHSPGYFDTGYRLSPGNYIVFVKCPGMDEIKANGGHQVTVNAGSVVTVNAVMMGESGRPWTGGHDAVGVGSPSADAFFAEGFTGVGFHQYLTVQNPNPAAQTLTATYTFAGGGAPMVKAYSLPAQQRITLNVNFEVGSSQQVSVHLHSDGTFVAERPMYFNYSGSIDGGHDVAGAQSLGSSFYFAEGTTLGGFSEFLTLQNPNASAVPVSLKYFTDSGARPVKSTVLPGNSRTTVEVFKGDLTNNGSCSPTGGNCGVGQGIPGVSVLVQSSGGPILAERPMYFNFPAAGGLTGGSVVVGAAAPSTELDLAEGFVAPGSFYEYLAMFNPGSTDATLTITYKLPGGGVKQMAGIVVQAGHRVTRAVNDDLPPFTSSSVHISSNQPVVVERPMYFNFGGRTGGHDAMAVDSSTLGSSAYFAEGTTLSSFSEFLTILNPNPSSVTATLTYLTDSGAKAVKTLSLAPNSRTTVEVGKGDLNATSNCDPGNSCGVGAGLQGVSVQIQAAGGLPILAERPMYFAF